MLLVDLTIITPFLLIFGISNAMIKHKTLEDVNTSKMVWCLFISLTLTLCVDFVTLLFSVLQATTIEITDENVI